MKCLQQKLISEDEDLKIEVEEFATTRRDSNLRSDNNDRSTSEYKPTKSILKLTTV